MAHQPGNQMPFMPKQPRTLGGFARALAEIVKAFVRIAFWIVVAFVAAGAAYMAVRGVIFACKIVLEAIGG